MLIDARFIPETVNLSQKDLMRIKRNYQGMSDLGKNAFLFHIFTVCVCVTSGACTFVCFCMSKDQGTSPDDRASFATAFNILVTLSAIAFLVIVSLRAYCRTLRNIDKKAIAKADTAGAVLYGTSYEASTCMRKLHGACRELGLYLTEYLQPKADGTLSPLGQEFRSSITRYLIQNDSLGQQITEAERVTPRDTELDGMLTEAHRIMEMHAEELALQMAVRAEEERQLAQIAPVERLAVAMSLHRSVA